MEEIHVDNSQLPPVSVILVTKDSGSVLRDNLPKILNQNYPSFEVIVINDKSTGEDEDILKRLSAEYSNLYYSFIPNTTRYVSNKKLGIAMGIRASRNEWLVFTEPYCYPVSENWLRSLASHFTSKTEIVLGYSNFEYATGWFARKITMQKLFNSLRYLGWAASGRPYMGIGKNLAYKKNLYEQHKGFSDHLQLLCGEDDLFINAVAHADNTKVAIGPESIVRQPVPLYKRIWQEEKISYMVTGHFYRGGGIRLLNALDTWTCVLFHLATLGGVVVSSMNQQWMTLIAFFSLWVVRLFCEIVVLKKSANDLNEKLGCVFLLFDLVRPWWSMWTWLQYTFRNKRDFMRK